VTNKQGVAPNQISYPSSSSHCATITPTLLVNIWKEAPPRRQKVTPVEVAEPEAAAPQSQIVGERYASANMKAIDQ
jgi:hypothetical protein